jgi:hypothetical protein
MSTRLLIDHSEYRYIALDGDILVEAFDGVLRDLGIVDRNDPEVREVVAKEIITFAKVGVHDPVRLRDLALEAVRVQRSRPPPWIPGRP